MRHDEPQTMMHLIRPLLLLLGVLVLLLVTEQVAGDTVRIYSVSGSDGPDVLLSQVAELDGDYANRFADTVVGRFEEGQSKVEIEAKTILTTMRKEGAKLGMLDLKGFGRCTVHLTFSGAQRADVSESEPIVSNIDERATSGAISVHTPTTVRSMIEHEIERATGIGIGSLEITFSERDETLLRASAVAGRYEVDPIVETTLGAVSFKVQAYQGTEKAGASKVVSARVQQRVIAVIAGDTIKRGEPIGRRQVRLREVLIDEIGQPYLSDTALVTGQVAARTIQPGEIITASSVKLPVAVKRRDRVSVELKTQGVRITFNGIAQDEGAVGETIEIENPQTRERFTATVVARGKVVAGDVVDRSKNKEKQELRDDE